MNIAVLTKEEKNCTGIGDVTVEISRRLKHIDPQNRYIYLGSVSWMNGVIEHEDNLVSYGNGSTNLNYVCEALEVDIVHSYYPVFDVKNKNVKRILTIHDLCGLHKECELSSNIESYYRNTLKKCANETDKIIAVSEYTKNDIVNCYNIKPEKIKVIYSGMTDKLKITNSIEIPSLKNTTYITMVSSLIKRKNMLGLAKAFLNYKKRKVNSDLKLVLVGENRRGIIEEILACGSGTEDIIFTGYVSDAELKWIYENSVAVAYTSLFEGFGLPILEAMSLGKAVISSNVTSMPEVGGDAVCYCDPYSIESMTDAIERVVDNDSFRKQLENKGVIQAKKFSYDKAALETLQLYEEVME